MFSDATLILDKIHSVCTANYKCSQLYPVNGESVCGSVVAFRSHLCK